MPADNNYPELEQIELFAEASAKRIISINDVESIKENMLDVINAMALKAKRGNVPAGNLILKVYPKLLKDDFEIDIWAVLREDNAGRR